MTDHPADPSLSEPPWLRRLLIAFVVATMLALIALPLAVVIVFGTISACALTLVLLPVLQRSWAKRIEKAK